MPELLIGEPKTENIPMLVNGATPYKKSFFLKKKNEQIEPIIDWIKALKARQDPSEDYQM